MRSGRQSRYGEHSSSRGGSTDLTIAQALSDFAEYVEQQQNLRFPTSRRTEPDAGASAESADHHEELDELFDNLDLADTAARIALKDLLLASDEGSLKKLQDLVAERIEEGIGETVFELGHENNGDSMKLTLEEWNTSYRRLVEAAKGIRADCELLLTNNVGGDVEAASTATKPSKETACSGKVLIRRVPSNVEDVIETRIAVVGNGKLACPRLQESLMADVPAETVDAGKSSMLGVLVKGDLDDGRGKARVNLFRHKHEMETGRTSSVGMEIMGFDSMGRVVTSDTPGRKYRHCVTLQYSLAHHSKGSSRGRTLGSAAPRSSHSPIWLATKSICEQRFLVCSLAAPTTACSWLRQTTGWSV